MVEVDVAAAEVAGIRDKGIKLDSFYAVSAQIRNFFAGDRDIVFINGKTVTEYYGINYMPAWGFVDSRSFELNCQCVLR